MYIHEKTQKANFLVDLGSRTMRNDETLKFVLKCHFMWESISPTEVEETWNSRKFLPCCDLGVMDCQRRGICH